MLANIGSYLGAAWRSSHRKVHCKHSEKRHYRMEPARGILPSREHPAPPEKRLLAHKRSNRIFPSIEEPTIQTSHRRNSKCITYPAMEATPGSYIPIKLFPVKKQWKQKYCSTNETKSNNVSDINIHDKKQVEKTFQKHNRCTQLGFMIGINSIPTLYATKATIQKIASSENRYNITINSKTDLCEAKTPIDNTCRVITKEMVEKSLQNWYTRTGNSKKDLINEPVYSVLLNIQLKEQTIVKQQKKPFFSNTSINYLKKVFPNVNHWITNLNLIDNKTTGKTTIINRKALSNKSNSLLTTEADFSQLPKYSCAVFSSTHFAEKDRRKNIRDSNVSIKFQDG